MGFRLQWCSGSPRRSLGHEPVDADDGEPADDEREHADRERRDRPRATEKRADTADGDREGDRSQREGEEDQRRRSENIPERAAGRTVDEVVRVGVLPGVESSGTRRVAVGTSVSDRGRSGGVVVRTVGAGDRTCESVRAVKKPTLGLWSELLQQPVVEPRLVAVSQLLDDELRGRPREVTFHRRAVHHQFAVL